MDSYGVYAIVLLIAGLAIMVFEVFIPSGGLLAITTTVVLVLSAICAFAAWFERSPAVWWTYCGMLVLLIPGTLGGTFYMLPKTSVGKKVLLEAPELSQVEPHSEHNSRLAKLIGKRGHALTMLNPGGMVLVEGERLHGFSEGIIVEPETTIEILEIRGTRVLVRPVSASAIAPVVEAADPDGLDFDVPAE